MPAGHYNSRLKAVLSYYDSVISVTPEGDSLVSDETLEGLGTDYSISSSLLYSLAGSLIRVASPLPRSTMPAASAPGPPKNTDVQVDVESRDAGSAGSKRRIHASVDVEIGTGSIADDQTVNKRRRLGNSTSTATQTGQHAGDGTSGEQSGQAQPSEGFVTPQKKYRLTDFAPDPGYFLAGAIAGGVSRTATAPLDRLKVYLLVNTSSCSETAASALKHGRPAAAVQNASRPIRDAVKDLFRNGGIRSFFAGRSPRLPANGIAPHVRALLTAHAIQEMA